ncbi:MAG: cytidine deaminase [Salinibacter sp.]
MTLSSSIGAARERAHALTARAHAPFSGEPTTAVLLLADGQWIPGVRVESAAYSLTIPAVLNAYTTAVALGRGDDVVAVVLSRPFRRPESLYVEELPHGPYDAWAADAWIRDSGSVNGTLPALDTVVSPYLDRSVADEAEGLRVARTAAEHAHVPSSHFPVGAVAETTDDRLVPGANVEHPDWARILCAERSALGTVLSYAAGPVDRLFLTCLEDPDGTPCGACRQLLAERAPTLVLWMDRHEAAPEEASIASLLPGSFRGQALLDSE